ncbi:MAG: FkbM family methyltransferase [Ferruginibacter sp.]
MLKSFTTLYQSPYNRKRPFFALYRFIEWKLIRLFHIKNYRKKIWDNRHIYINYDSYHSMWLMYNWVVDWEEFNLIKSIGKQGGIAMDIGANMGYYSIWMSGYYDMVHSFEPNNENHQRLTANISTNDIRNIIPNKSGIGSYTGNAYFTKNKDAENHLVVTDNGEEKEMITLDTVDNYCKANNVNHIDYLKIDVEGFEYDVLLGAEKMLREKKINILQLEINRSLKFSGKTPDALEKLLEEHGYSLASFDVEKCVLKPVSFNEGRENYFAVYAIDQMNQILGKTL